MAQEEMSFNDIMTECGDAAQAVFENADGFKMPKSGEAKVLITKTKWGTYQQNAQTLPRVSIHFDILETTDADMVAEFPNGFWNGFRLGNPIDCRNFKTMALVIDPECANTVRAAGAAVEAAVGTGIVNVRFSEREYQKNGETKKAINMDVVA